jgi:hypothetical protein
MISVSLLVVLLVAAWISVQYGKAKVATLILGVCLGLALANTSFGAWGLDALNTLLNNLFLGANNMVEG